MGSNVISKPLPTFLSCAVNKSQQHQEKKVLGRAEAPMLGENELCFFSAMQPLLFYKFIFN